MNAPPLLICSVSLSFLTSMNACAEHIFSERSNLSDCLCSFQLFSSSICYSFTTETKVTNEIEKSNAIYINIHMHILHALARHTYGSECCRKSLWQCSENYAFGTHKHSWTIRIRIQAQCNCASWLLMPVSRMGFESELQLCVMRMMFMGVWWCLSSVVQRLRTKQLNCFELSYWSFVYNFVNRVDRLNGTTPAQLVYDFMHARGVFFPDTYAHSTKQSRRTNNSSGSSSSNNKNNNEAIFWRVTTQSSTTAASTWTIAL